MVNFVSIAPQCHLLVVTVLVVCIVVVDLFDTYFFHTFAFQDVLYSSFIYSILAVDRTGKADFGFKIFTSEKGLYNGDFRLFLLVLAALV